jgi:hypothetical protein
VRFHHILVNFFAGILALAGSFAFLTWRENDEDRRLAENVRAGESSRDRLESPTRAPGTRTEDPSLKVALSSLARAAVAGQTQIKARVPDPLSGLVKLGLRYENVDQIERKARNVAIGRVINLCQDSFGDRQKMRLIYNVRLERRSAAFDLTSSAVEEGASLSPELAHCIETVASRIDLELKPGFADFPPFEGSAWWSFPVQNRRLAASPNTSGTQ